LALICLRPLQRVCSSSLGRAGTPANSTAPIPERGSRRRKVLAPGRDLPANFLGRTWAGQLGDPKPRRAATPRPVCFEPVVRPRLARVGGAQDHLPCWCPPPAPPAGTTAMTGLGHRRDRRCTSMYVQPAPSLAAVKSSRRLALGVRLSPSRRRDALVAASQKRPARRPRRRARCRLISTQAHVRRSSRAVVERLDQLVLTCAAGKGVADFLAV